MKQQSKFSQNQQNAEQQLGAHEMQQQQQAGHEFASADELLRFDAKNTMVPPEIAQRLRQSSQSVPPRRSWWKNLFGQ